MFPSRQVKIVRRTSTRLLRRPVPQIPVSSRARSLLPSRRTLTSGPRSSVTRRLPAPASDHSQSVSTIVADGIRSRIQYSTPPGELPATLAVRRSRQVKHTTRVTGLSRRRELTGPRRGSRLDPERGREGREEERGYRRDRPTRTPPVPTNGGGRGADAREHRVGADSTDGRPAFARVVPRKMRRSRLRRLVGQQSWSSFQVS
jgi:hypothetical protein